MVICDKLVASCDWTVHVQVRGDMTESRAGTGVKRSLFSGKRYDENSIFLSKDLDLGLMISFIVFSG